MKKNNYFSESSFWLRALIGVLVLVLGIGLVAVIAGDLISDTPDGNEGEDINTETEEARGDPNCAHVFGSESKVIKAATCKDPGVMGYTCTLCGYVDKDNEIPKTDEHQYGAPKNNTKDGNHMYTCSICGNTTFEDHDLKESVVNSTCTSKGAQIFSCVCGYVEKNDIDPVGHDITVRKQIVGDAVNHTAYCSNCATVISEAHTYGQEITVVEPTCTGAGLKQKTCTGCGYVKDSVIASLGHEYEEDTTWEGRIEPTCTTTGMGLMVCQRKGCNYSSQKVIAALGHRDLFAEMDGTSTHALICGVCQIKVKDESHVDSGVYEQLDRMDDNCGDYHLAFCSICDQSFYKEHHFVEAPGFSYETCKDCGFTP